MKTITTLLLLLLASPVFAETWVCPYSSLVGLVFSNTYTRSGDHFLSPRETLGDLEYTIMYEDESFIVLHRTHVLEDFSPMPVTLLVHIQKTSPYAFRSFNMSHAIPILEGVTKENEGYCVVVE